MLPIGEIFTTDEILNMPAGPAMNALIAEYIIVPAHNHVRSDVNLCVSGGEFYEETPGESFVRSYPIPDYSNDLAAAWLVVEVVTRPPGTQQDAVRMVNTKFYYMFKESNICCCNSAEAALEICRMALLARFK